MDTLKVFMKSFSEDFPTIIPGPSYIYLIRNKLKPNSSVTQTKGV